MNETGVGWWGVRYAYASYTAGMSVCGVGLNAVVVLLSAHPRLAGQDFVLLVNAVAVAVAGVVASVGRGLVRVPLAVLDDAALGNSFDSLCRFGGFVSQFNVLINIFSVHPMFLHRYLCARWPEWSGLTQKTWLRSLFFGFPYLIGVIYGRPYLHFAVDGTRRYELGLKCRFSATAKVSSVYVWFLLGLILLHFALLAFYFRAVRMVLKIRTAFQLSRSEVELVAETRQVMRVALTQALGPIVLACPILVLILIKLAITTSSHSQQVLDLFVKELFHLTPVYNALAVLLLLKPYRRIIQDFIRPQATDVLPIGPLKSRPQA